MIKIFKNITHGLLVIFTTVVFVGEIAAQQNKGLSGSDKKALLKIVFEDSFIKLMEDEALADCSIPVVNGEKIVLVKTVERSIFPKAPEGYRFRLLSPKHIEAEIKSNDGDCYLELNNFQRIGARTFKIVIWRWIEVVNFFNGKSAYPSRWVAASGRVYEAVKAGKRWSVKFTGDTWAAS